MNNITIHRVDGKNLSEIVPGIVKVFRDDEVVPWHKYDECLAWVTKRAERGFYITLAYDGDTIVGYSEWILTYDNSKKILYLGIMQVDCDLRSRGIGKIMLDDGEEYAKSIGAAVLRTIPEDDRSQNFYYKYGFTETDLIYYCVCSTTESADTPKSHKSDKLPTLEIADTHELVFGLCQSSGRHMYEIANHNPAIGEFGAVTAYIQSGYLQFRYREGSETALALYWSNEETTADTVSAILTQVYYQCARSKTSALGRRALA